MEFVDIHAGRSAKLSGGRRDSGLVSFGTNNTSSNLVPASQLPASAGALGGTDLHSVLGGLGRKRAKKSGGAFIIGKDGKAHGVGSDDPKIYANLMSGGMGGPATLQHGENHQLGQFHGGAMKKPLGFPSPMISPGVSRMAVGFGRPGKPMGADPRTYTPKHLPKAKSLMNVVHLMASGRHKCGGAMSGGDLLGDAWGQLKSLGMDLVKELGPVVWTELKGVLKEELKKGIHNYASSGSSKTGSGRKSSIEPKHLRKAVGCKFMKDFEKELLSGGDFWNDLGGYTKDFALDVGKEILPIVKEEATNALRESIRSGLSGKKSSSASTEGAGRRGRKKGGKFDLLRDITSVGTKLGEPFHVTTGVNPFTFGYDLGHDVIAPALKKRRAKKSGGDFWKDALGAGKDLLVKEVLPIVKEEGIKLAKDSLRNAISGRKSSSSAPSGAGRGGKKYTARGAIVADVMKKHGLSLPQASKYVKEHGLY